MTTAAEETPRPEWSLRAALREGWAAFTANYPRLVALAVLFSLPGWLLDVAYLVLRRTAHVTIDHGMRLVVGYLTSACAMLGSIAIGFQVRAWRSGERPPLMYPLRAALPAWWAALVIRIVLSIPKRAEELAHSVVLSTMKQTHTFREIGNVNMIVVVLFLAANVYLSAIWLYAPVHAGLQRAGPFEALRGSAALMKGRFWRTAALAQLIAVPAAIVQYGIPFVVLASGLSMTAWTVSRWTVLPLAALVPLAPAFAAVSYLLLTKSSAAPGAVPAQTPS